MKKAIIFYSEAEFREWFDKHFEELGIKKIILSQHPCPDYIVEMKTGEIAKIEAELFAINFKYHNHDPKKVDYILSCYAKESAVSGIPVITLNKLWVYEDEPLSPLPPEGPLSENEFILLGIISFNVSMELSALSIGRFFGDQALFLRLTPEFISSVPRGKVEDSLFGVVSPEAKKYIKKYHHILIGSGLSEDACESLEKLGCRGLIKINPISVITALYDGTFIKHDGWIPTEVCLTEIAKSIYTEKLKKWHLSQLKST